MDCDKPHLVSNEKMQPIQWIEQPTGALMATGSLWPNTLNFEHLTWRRFFRGTQFAYQILDSFTRSNAKKCRPTDNKFSDILRITTQFNAPIKTLMEDMTLTLDSVKSIWY
jgi:hypothetical protein